MPSLPVNAATDHVQSFEKRYTRCTGYGYSRRCRYSSLSPAARIGIGIAAAVVAVILFVLLGIMCRRRRAARFNSQPAFQPAITPGMQQHESSGGNPYAAGAGAYGGSGAYPQQGSQQQGSYPPQNYQQNSFAPPSGPPPGHSKDAESAPEMVDGNVYAAPPGPPPPTYQKQ